MIANKTQALLNIAAVLFLFTSIIGLSRFKKEIEPWYPTAIVSSEDLNADYWTSMEDMTGSIADGDTIIYPVKVIGPPNYIKSVTLNSTDGASVDSIFIKIFNIGWDGSDNPSGESKARFRINGGAWTEISNETATCTRWNEKVSGCLSIFPTSSVAIPVTGVNTGTNTVEFQYLLDPNVRSANHGHGYRIYDLAWIESDGDYQRDYVSLEEDPNDWTAPGGSNVVNGRNFFTDSTSLVRNGFGETTTCQHCHPGKGAERTWWGVDLALFNYSPQAIRQVVLDARPADSSETWMQQNADDVVAYVLSLVDSLNTRGFTEEFTNAGYDNADLFRPHSLMYQPCHLVNTDTMAVEFWGAGGGFYTDWGYDCVLETDEEMAEYMFADTGGKISWKSSYIHVDSLANPRVLPVPYQNPSWNLWLPRQDPYEIWDGNSGRIDFLGTSFYNQFATQLPSDILGGSSSTIENSLNEFWTDGKDFADLDPKDPGNFDDTVAPGSGAHMSIAQWQVSQTFGFYYFDKLEELAPVVYGPSTNAKTPHARSWLGSTSRVTFDMAPHIMDGGGDVDIYGTDQSFRDQYHDSIWYENACSIFNSGNGNGAQFRPCDWKYTYGHLGDYKKITDGFPMKTGFRMARMYATAMQNGSNHGYTSEWMVRHLNISQLFSSIGGRKFALDDMDPLKRDSLVEALVRSQMHFLFPSEASDWTCVDSDGPSPGAAEFECPGEDILTMGTTISSGEFAGLPDGFNQFRPDLSYYRALPVLEHFNVAPTLIDSVARWIDKMGWDPAPGEPPLSDWYISAPPSAPTLTSPADAATDQNLTLSLSWNVASNATSYDVQVDDDDDFSSVILSENVATTSTSFSGDQGETYYWRIRARNSLGFSSWSDSRSFTMLTITSIFTDVDWAGAGGSRTPGSGDIQVVTGQGIMGTLPARPNLDGYGSFVDFVDGDTAWVKIDSLGGTSDSFYRTASLLAVVDVDSTAQFYSTELVGNSRIRLVTKTDDTPPDWVETLRYVVVPYGICLRVVRDGKTFKGGYKLSGDCYTGGYTEFSSGFVELPGIASASDTVKVGIFVSGGATNGTDTAIAYTSGFRVSESSPTPPTEDCVTTSGDMIPLDRTDLLTSGQCYDAGTDNLSAAVPYTWANQTADKDQPVGSVIIGTGYSNATQIFTVFESTYGSLIAPTFIDCAVSSNAIENWTGSNAATLFNACITKIEDAGFTAADVGMTFNQIANQLTYAAFPFAANGVEALETQLVTMGELLESYFPNAIHLYSSGEPATWVAESKCPRICEPIRYESAFGINEFLSNANPSIDMDKHLRGAYLWSAEGVPNASGVEFECDDFLPEGAGCPTEANQHPGTTGRAKAASIYYDFLIDNYPAWAEN